MFWYQNKLAESQPYRQWLTKEESLYKQMEPERKILEITKAEIYSDYVKSGGKPIFNQVN